MDACNSFCLILFIVINIVLLQFILPCVAPVGRIVVYVFPNINNRSIEAVAVKGLVEELLIFEDTEDN